MSMKRPSGFVIHLIFVQGLDLQIDGLSHTPMGENESNASIHNSTVNFFHMNDSETV